MASPRKAGKGSKRAVKAGTEKETKHYVVVSASAGGTEGSYSSRSGPAAAARKAASRRFTSSTTKVRITLRQTGAERTFTYDVRRVKLAEPYVSQIAGREVVRKFKTEVKAIKK